MIAIRTGMTPTHTVRYWFPHIAFPSGFGPRFVWGALGFWAFGRKLEVSWDFRKEPSPR